MHSDAETAILKRLATLDKQSEAQQKTINSLGEEIKILKERMIYLKDKHHPTGKSKSFKEAGESEGDRARRLVAFRGRS